MQYPKSRRWPKYSTHSSIRPDTAASVTHLVNLLRRSQNLPSELHLLDLCTGTGCIPLLFQHELLSARKDIDLRLLGVDISKKALDLAQSNLQRLVKSQPFGKRAQTSFVQADVLIDPSADQSGKILPLRAALNYALQPAQWDILISNPPYVSPSAFWKTTTRSVRAFEPKLALVPPSRAKYTDTQQGDMFYPHLLQIARDVEAKVVLLEVADMEQALRVASTARHLHLFDGIEIWKEDPTAASTVMTKDEFDIIGEGNARSVVCWRGRGTSWLGKSATDTATPTAEADSLSWNSPKVDTHHLEPQFIKSVASGEGR